MGTSLEQRTFLTPEEIAEAYQAVRDDCDPRAHALLNKLEELAQVDHRLCCIYADGVTDLGALLAGHAEAVTDAGEFDPPRLRVPRPSPWPGGIERSEAVRDEHDRSL